MKLKTYLRGLGIGIIVTTIVMAVALGGKKEKLSDEEIVVRAKQLGMVEGTQKDSDNKKEPEKKTEITEPEDAGKTEAESKNEQQGNAEAENENKVEPQSNAEVETGNKTEPQSEAQGEEESKTGADQVQAGELEENPDNSEEEKMAAAANAGEVTAGAIVSISIANGDDSATVSRRLEELDLVVSATQFDKFLCDNGYAKKLSPGDYEIAIGSSEETIAKIITKSR